MYGRNTLALKMDLGKMASNSKKGKKLKVGNGGENSVSQNAYINQGRKNQKLRTRDALVAAAAEVLRAGKPVSVADVADAARVSRTTAYRYFPTSEMLAAQAALAVFPQTEVLELEAIAAGPGSPEEKLNAIIGGTDEMVEGHEAAFRSLVRFTVERRNTPDPTRPRRPSYRRQWLQAALADVEADLGPERLDKLTAALSMLCGVESFIVLHDICQLPRKEALAVKQWAGRKLLQAALEEAEGEDAAANKHIVIR